MRTVRWVAIATIIISIGYTGFIFFKSLTLSSNQNKLESEPHNTSSLATDSLSKPIRIVLFSPTPSIRNLGVVPTAARVDVPFVVVNDGVAAVTLGEFATSCECLSGVISRRTVGAGESVSGAIILDFRKEPDFRGGLLLSAQVGVAGDPQRIAFTIELTVDVK